MIKEFSKEKIKNTDIEKGIDYFQKIDTVSINGVIHNAGWRALSVCILNENGWRDLVNFQDGLKHSGVIDGTTAINKNETLYVVGRNSGVYYLDGNKWMTEYEPDGFMKKKLLFNANYDEENDRFVISGGYSGKPSKYRPYNTETYLYKDNKWKRIPNKVFKQECKDNMTERKSKPYEHIKMLTSMQCYDSNLKKVIMLGEKYSYLLEDNKWVHHKTEGLELQVDRDQRRIFHVKHLKKTLILNKDGMLYEYSVSQITPFGKIDLTDLGFLFYNCSCHYNDKEQLLYLFGRDVDGAGFTVKI